MLVVILILAIAAASLCVTLLIRQERFSRLAKIILLIIFGIVLLLLIGLGTFIYLLRHTPDGTPAAPTSVATTATPLTA